MFTGAGGHLTIFVDTRNHVRVTRVQVLGRTCVDLPRRLEDILWLFNSVLGAQGVCQLHLGVIEHLLLKVIDLALLVICLAFDRPQSAVVLVARANGHVVETVV